MNLSQVSEEVKVLKKRGKSIGLITGCFDILHSGHRKLFKLSKEKVGILIVGVDCDETVRLNKDGRPINPLAVRIENLKRERYINFVFPIMKSFKFDTTESRKCHERIWKQLKPDFLITCSTRDELVKIKIEESQRFGIKFLDIETDDPSSTTGIISNNPKDLQS